MSQSVLAVLFTAAGIGAALLALRAAGESVVVRWLARGFCVLALGNLVLELWPYLTADPGGTGLALGISAILALVAWGYARLLRAVRRRAAGERDGR